MGWGKGHLPRILSSSLPAIVTLVTAVGVSSCDIGASSYRLCTNLGQISPGGYVTFSQAGQGQPVYWSARARSSNSTNDSLLNNSGTWNVDVGANRYKVGAYSAQYAPTRVFESGHAFVAGVILSLDGWASYGSIRRHVGGYCRIEWTTY